MSADARFLDVRDVRLRYGDAATGTHALRGVTLRAESGEVLMIRGPSGSGKTTLLQLMGALKPPDSGAVVICGETTDGASVAQMRALRLKRVGFIFQFFNLFPTLSALENVAVPLDLYGVGMAEGRRLAREALGELGLAECADRKPGHLSGGQRQRVAVARALINDPDVILADEPTAALDGENGALVMGALRRLAHERDRVVVVVSHDRRLESQADRIVTIEDGLLTANQALRSEPGIDA